MSTTNCSLLNNEVMKMIEQTSSIAKKREPDFVLVPLSFFTKARCLPLLNNICCQLGSKLGVEAEFKCVWETLPSPRKTRMEKTLMMNPIFRACML